MRTPTERPPTLSPLKIRQLALFRYNLRQFLRFSEKAARAAGITPQQYQLMLGVWGFSGRGWATISELAEFLQERHNAVVGLVDRAQRRGLITKKIMPRDHRFVRVELTAPGKRVMLDLAALHRTELAKFERKISVALAPALKSPAMKRYRAANDGVDR
ncbi:MAG: MarR family winged helix-turn-helix transcriptional regulator [Terriglobia bacterium]